MGEIEKDNVGNNSVKSTKTPIKALMNKRSLIVIVVAIVFLALGYWLGSFRESDTQEVAENLEVQPITNTDPRALLDPIEVLKSPVFIEWNGAVEGTIIEKTSEHFTIEKNGRQLKIYLQESLTGFYEELEDPTQLPGQITYAQVSVGDNVRGGVTISRSTLDNDPNHHIFANVFTVINNAQGN